VEGRDREEGRISRGIDIAFWNVVGLRGKDRDFCETLRGF